MLESKNNCNDDNTILETATAKGIEKDDEDMAPPKITSHSTTGAIPPVAISHSAAMPHKP